MAEIQKWVWANTVHLCVPSGLWAFLYITHQCKEDHTHCPDKQTNGDSARRHYIVYLWDVNIKSVVSKDAEIKFGWQAVILRFQILYIYTVILYMWKTHGLFIYLLFFILWNTRVYFQEWTSYCITVVPKTWRHAKDKNEFPNKCFVLFCSSANI